MLEHYISLQIFCKFKNILKLKVRKKYKYKYDQTSLPGSSVHGIL